WGAEVLDGGKARFRLWAPGLESLQLVHGSGRHALSMEQTSDGWFEAVTDRIGQGEPYAFRLPDGAIVPDPASRAQEGDVHGASRLIDPRSFRWRTGGWPDPPWYEAVIYELHIGTFANAGMFDVVAVRLEHLASTGITAIELMP